MSKRVKGSFYRINLVSYVADTFPTYFTDFNEWYEGFMSLSSMTNGAIKHYIDNFGAGSSLHIYMEMIYDNEQLEEFNEELAHMYGLTIIRIDRQFVISACNMLQSRPKNI